MANRVSSAKISDEQLEEIRSAFAAIDTDNNGFIVAAELGTALQSAGINVPGYELRHIIAKYDSYEDQKLDMNEFINCWTDLQTQKSKVALGFKKMVVKREHLKTHGGSTMASSEGTTHSYSFEETNAFTDWINSVLHLKIGIDDGTSDAENKSNLFEAVHDGILLCKLINSAVPNTIDERCINQGKGMNTFKLMENHELAISSASSIGCNVVNIGATNIRDGTPHIVLGLMWQIIRIGLLNDINLASHPGLIHLLEEDETLEDLQRLTPEQILIRWVNYHMKQAGLDRRIKGFTAQDIGDSEVYSHLLFQIAPDNLDVGLIAMVNDHEKRAELMLCEADKMDCRSFVTAKDVVDGNYRLNLAFVANLFNKYPALEPPEHMEEMEFEETREEKTYRNWMNSIGISPFVHHLYSDLNSGLILLKLYDLIKPGIVDWKRVVMDFKKTRASFDKIANCNYCVELAKEMKFSTVGLGGKDIHDGNKTLSLALVWQLMRAYTLSILSRLKGSTEKPTTDAEIIAWANETLRGAKKSKSFTSFMDPVLKDGVVIADLLDAIRPGCINNSCIDRDCLDDEQRYENAKYVITMARKLGARVYALPEDIVELKKKMIMTIFACIMVRVLEKQKNAQE